MNLNIAGIAVLLFFTIFLRRNLKKMNREIDDKILSPSDYALMIHNIPLNMTEIQLKEYIEQEF